MDQASLIAKVDQLRSQGREANTVEFKSNCDQTRDFGGYLSAMANAAVLARHDQAWLVWGIDDSTHKVRNLLQAIRRDQLIYRTSPKATAVWHLDAEPADAQS